MPDANFFEMTDHKWTSQRPSTSQWQLPVCLHFHHDRTEIVDADVCELRATCNLADRPDAGRGSLQPLIDLDVSPVGELNAGQF